MFVLDASSWHQVWRFVTAIFLHGDLLHLVYNMFALLLFGSIVEGLIGGRRFLIVYFVTGILANIVAVNFYASSLGASGAIYGVIGALIVLRPGLIVWAFGIPMPMVVAGALWVIGDAMGIFMPSNIANIAHLSGIGLGIVFGFMFRKYALEELKEERRSERGKVTIDERSIRAWEDNYLR
jgi:membrane associated rhomboid family serine protease